MKTIYTLLFLSFTLLAHSQFIRLDSIIYDDLESDEIYTTAYEYDSDLNLTLIKNLEGEDLFFNFTYGENDRISSMNVIEDLDNLNWTFFYDDTDNLEKIEAMSTSDGYDVLVTYTITEEDGLIKRVVNDVDYGGYLFKDSDISYVYNSQNRLDSIIEVDVFYNTGIANITNFMYDGNSKINNVVYEDFETPDFNTVDSFSFTADGITERVMRTNDLNEILLDLNYENAVSFEDDELISPFYFYELAYLVFDEDYPEIIYTLYNNHRPESNFYKTENTIYKMDWFYTLFTDTKEIPAQLISVFPNPTADFVNIEVEAIEKVEIYSVSGELLKTDLSQENTIDLTSLSSGTYFLMIYSAEGKNYLSKVVKQ